MGPLLSAAAVLLCLVNAFGQIDSVDLEEGILLDTIYYYNVRSENGREEFKAGLGFKFRDIADHYFHGVKDNHLFVEFYDAVVVSKPGPENLGEPFMDIKITTRKDNVQLMDDLAPKMRSIVHIELELEKDIEYSYTVVGGQKLITLTMPWSKSGATLEQRRETRRKILKYSVGGVIVAGLIGGIIYLVNDSKDTETGRITVR